MWNSGTPILISSPNSKKKDLGKLFITTRWRWFGEDLFFHGNFYRRSGRVVQQSTIRHPSLLFPLWSWKHPQHDEVSLHYCSRREWRWICGSSVGRAKQKGSSYQRAYGGKMPAMPGHPLCPVASLRKYVSKLHPSCSKLWQRARDSLNDEAWWSMR